MVEQIQVKTETFNPTLEEQAAAQQAAVTPQEDGEKKILGKFSSYEELEKSYEELEKKLSQGKPSENAAQEDQDEGNAEEGEGSPAEEDQARQAVENAGLDFDALTATYAETGELSDDDYSALEKAGIPRNVVDEFIAGQEARAALLESKVFNTVGSAEQYAEMTNWAGENLTEDEVEIYNREVNSGDEKRIMYAVKSLKAQYERATGFEPQRQIGGKTAATDNTVYKSWAQVTADMADPRYSTDPAFRKNVEAKLARSGTIT